MARSEVTSSEGCGSGEGSHPEVEWPSTREQVGRKERGVDGGSNLCTRGGGLPSPCPCTFLLMSGASWGAPFPFAQHTSCKPRGGRDMAQWAATLTAGVLSPRWPPAEEGSLSMGWPRQNLGSRNIFPSRQALCGMKTPILHHIPRPPLPSHHSDSPFPQELGSEGKLEGRFAI